MKECTKMWDNYSLDNKVGEKVVCEKVGRSFFYQMNKECVTSLEFCQFHLPARTCIDCSFCGYEYSILITLILVTMWHRSDIMLWLTQLITCDEECRLRQVLHCPHPTYNPLIGYSTQIVLMRQSLLKHRRPSFLRHSTICRTTLPVL